MQAQLEKYNSLLVGANKIHNLTAHRTLQDSQKFNIDDSLLFQDVVQKYVGEGAKVLDIGSGCGSPAIPLKIALPQLDMIMVDSVNKKVVFLNDAVAELGLNNIRAVHSRIEDLRSVCSPSESVRTQSYDIITARAVAPLNTLLEYALPLLCVGGVLLAYKGPSVNDEVAQSQNALNTLGGEVIEIITRNLDSDTQRTIVVVKKIRPTPKGYPRGKNLPRTKPL